MSKSIQASLFGQPDASPEKKAVPIKRDVPLEPPRIEPYGEPDKRGVYCYQKLWKLYAEAPEMAQAMIYQLLTANADVKEAVCKAIRIYDRSSRYEKDDIEIAVMA